MIYIKKLKNFNNSKGDLLVFEHKNFKHFKIKRSFFINFKLQNIIRGRHAHKKCSQFIFCLSGSIKIKSIDVKGNKKTFTLSDMKTGLLVKPLVWLELISQIKDSTLVCFADYNYEKSDYIYDIDNFKNLK